MDVGGASSASPDYGLYTYDALGQVISGKRYWSDGTPVAGQQFEYGFDDIGNRKVARRGGDENGWNLRQSIYTANLLNQYTQRTVPGFVDIIGIALATNPVYVNGQMASRKGEYFRRELSVNKAGAPVWLGVTVTSPGGPTVTGNLFVPRTPEAFTHDLDGNLTSDGRWNYWWDGENRLVRVQSRSDTPQGSWRRVEWQYDALGRRIRQTTWNWLVQSNLWVVTEDLKFVSDPLLYGRHVVDLNASNNVPVRTYVWGLDLSETMDGAGGVGGLLWLTLHTASGSAAGTHFCTYDGNGNVVVLVNASDGSVTARYEYGPFAEPIRLTGPAATLNPFRFSTKRTCNTTDLVLYEYRVYNPILGRWPCRDPVDESGSKLLRGERPKYRVDRELIGQTRLDEEKNLYRSVLNDPISRYDYLGLGHNFGRCCNESGGVEWALLDGRWRMLNPGECTGIFEDCDGMTCGGGFYYVLAFEWAACITPGCDSPPFTNRRWQPDGGGDPGGKPPSGEGGRGSLEGDVPPGYKYGPRPPCSCKNPRPGAVHNR